MTDTSTITEAPETEAETIKPTPGTALAVVPTPTSQGTLGERKARKHRPAKAAPPATFVVDGRTFAATVKAVAKVAGKAIGNFTPSVVLAFKDQRVTVAATDFEATATVKLAVKGKRATTVAVEAAKLRDFAKAFAGEGDVTITVAAGMLTITAGETQFVMRIHEDVPAIVVPKLTGSAVFDLPAFQRVVDIAGPCASTDEARPILTGINFDADGTAVATDAYRMAVVRDAPAGLAGVIVPAGAAKVAAALFADAEAVTFGIDEGRLTIRSAATTFTVRLIEGEFPQWRSLLRTDDKYHVTVSRTQLLDAVTKVGLCSKDGQTPVSVTTNKGVMHLQVAPPDAATADADVTLTNGTRTVPGHGFNPKYMAQMLKAVAGSTNVRLGYVDSLKPISVRDADGDSQWQLILMPVRIPE